jgi:hypothetical protein
LTRLANWIGCWGDPLNQDESHNSESAPLVRIATSAQLAKRQAL